MKRAGLSDLRTAPYDVLVIGGGIYGAMTARDAALRGLRVALVERGDFGAETSHNSLKLMHGGIRYVQHLDFARLRASARERAFWQFAAPDLVRPLEFVIPLTGYGIKGPEAFAAAATLYNIASTGLRGPDYPAARVLGRAAARNRLGDHAPDDLRGGGLWRDGQILDANRLQLAALRAASEAQADLANYMRVDGLRTEAGRVTGARLHDEVTGEEGEVSAHVILSCTGAAAAELAAPVLPEGAQARFPGFARATNITVDRPGGTYGLGVVSRARSDAVVDRGGRMYFLTPWRDKLIIGTHEAPGPGTHIPPRAGKDIDDFLGELDLACPSLALTRGDILHVYQGLIPADVDDSRGDVRRQTKGTLIDHRAADDVAGLISVIGVKYTTARLIAERAVDLAVAQLGRGGASPSLTTELPAVGLASCDPDCPDSTSGRVREAVQGEMAVTLADLVLRRMPLAETGGLRGSAGQARLAAVADLMAAERGWDAELKQAEIAAVLRDIETSRPESVKLG
ncbi:FAD-dependent oxidoreductase [Ruegeria sp. 2012CJ41-6]|uniref:FAD-dependent oxidoreductase n=1 Tax=Ruegeria spongiae TaxID=2942209 RepID=A0ABT0Q5Y7_9RHOB|nr:FAD-dependent oxidoreductase [Ruegeria spongiae]MCL6285286.1 FAD-dependent oxidoreductase [Ruegeria spongiae]